MTDRRAHSRPSPDRRVQHAERDLRDQWCAQRRVGDHVAVFQVGATVRCPGTKHLRHTDRDVVCGSPMGMVRLGSIVTVLAGSACATARLGGIDQVCGNCGMHQVVLEDARDGRAA